MHILWIKFHYLVSLSCSWFLLSQQNKPLAIANVQEQHLAAIQANFRYLGSRTIGLLVQPHASQPNPDPSALLSENKQLLRLTSCGKSCVRILKVGSGAENFTPLYKEILETSVRVLGQEREGTPWLSKRIRLGDSWTREGQGCGFHGRLSARAQGSPGIFLALSRERPRFYSPRQLGAYERSHSGQCLTP